MFIWTKDTVEKIEEAHELDARLYNEKVLPLWIRTAKRYMELATDPIVARDAKREQLTVPAYLVKKIDTNVRINSGYCSFLDMLNYIEGWSTHNRQTFVHIMPDAWEPYSFICNIYALDGNRDFISSYVVQLGVECGVDRDFLLKLKHDFTMGLIFHGEDSGWNTHS